MRRTLVFVLILISGVTTRAQPLDAPQGSTSPVPNKLLHAELSDRKDGQATTKFFVDTPRIYAVWKGAALKAGDKLRAVWIAEDVGFIAPRDAKISQASVTADRPDDGGVFSLARPQGGWPIGKYRFEIYVGYDLSETLSFTIEKSATVELR